MGKYDDKIRQLEMGNVEAFYAAGMFTLSNELAEANRLERIRIQLDYPTRTETGFILLKKEDLEDQA